MQALSSNFAPNYENEKKYLLHRHHDNIIGC